MGGALQGGTRGGVVLKCTPWGIESPPMLIIMVANIYKLQTT